MTHVRMCDTKAPITNVQQKVRVNRNEHLKGVIPTLTLRSSPATFFFKNFFIDALSLPSMSAVADCTASAVSSNFLKAFSLTL